MTTLHASPSLTLLSFEEAGKNGFLLSIDINKICEDAVPREALEVCEADRFITYWKIGWLTEFYDTVERLEFLDQKAAQQFIITLVDKSLRAEDLETVDLLLGMLIPEKLLPSIIKYILILTAPCRTLLNKMEFFTRAISKHKDKKDEWAVYL